MASTFMQQFAKKKSVLKRSTKKYLDVALYKKIFSDGGEDQIVREKLNQFLKSRKSAFKWEVGHTLKTLRSRKLYGPALKNLVLAKDIGFMRDLVEINRLRNSREHIRCFDDALTEFTDSIVIMIPKLMTIRDDGEKRNEQTINDQAIHLDLIAKGRGIAAAEAYFTSLPESSKNHLTYGALLNCYCKESMTEKAQALFEKMKELNLELTSMPYNSLMTLYLKNGMPQMVQPFIQEMKEADIMPDTYTYNVWMRALASVNDISGVERVIDEMKRDGRVAGDWTTYSNLASIYATAGLFEKAEKALKELESKNACKDISAYHFLITLYGRTGNLLEVYRVWRSLKLAFPKTANISYLNMIQVLVTLNDLPGAEKCFHEWSSGCSTYDIRIANVLIGAYLKEGSYKKADNLKYLSQKRGTKPNAKTWELFLDFHLKNGNMKSVVRCIENAISVGRGNGGKWTPSPAVVEKLMKHFEEKKDVEGAEGLLEILKKSEDDLRREVLESLIRTYAAAGKKSPIMRRRIKMENVELSDEGKTLLNDISEE